ncbi:methylaspartate mutase [Streptomyces sp. NBC_00442]|uniref:methylaspartate mutase n=1 Tax=Streptomyces sp. NBC_00442 TaxID=2903651 RepID=UPI002E1AA5C8
MTAPPVSFGGFVARARAAGTLVVQPRMGMSRPGPMRAGLHATRLAAATTVGTITVDSYTRTGELAAARRAVAQGAPLNGYPIATHAPRVTRGVLEGICGPDFPVQVRHGSARPGPVFAALQACGLHATEGGPVSYCLPYSRVPLATAVADWERCCGLLAEAHQGDVLPHLETFGGCMMGQLCPPALLVALSVLEALFFRRHGLRSISLSYAQQANAHQDEEALTVLAALAAELLPDVDWHVVLYAYMGLYPLSPGGAQLLLDEAARLAVRTGAARLVVKTTAEAHRIPTVEENVRALETAAATAAATPPSAGPVPDTGIHAEARALVEAVLDLDDDIGRALVLAFAKGYLDVPYCLHPDNAGRVRSLLDSEGRLQWAETGALPLPGRRVRGGRAIVGSADLLGALSHVRRTFDQRAFSGV